MTSRERVEAILQHKDADKIPIDFGGMHSSGMSAITYNELKKALQIEGGETKVYDIPQQLAIPEDWYLERFQVDVIDMARAYANNPDDWVDWTLRDGSAAKYPAWIRIEARGEDFVCYNDEGEEIALMPEGSIFFDQTLWPLFDKHPDTFDNLPELFNKIMWTATPDPLWKHAGDPDFYANLRQTAKRLYEETDFAITMNYGSLIFELTQWFFRNDEFFIRLISERKQMETLLDTLVEYHLERLGPLLEAVSPYAQVLVMGDDLGMQTRPLVSPKMYREMFFPRHKKIFQFIKKHSNLRTFLHSCGAIAPLIPDLIEAGVDIINPVQTHATGMEPEKLKREFGKDMVFWGGGVDTQHTLFHASEQEVRDEVKRNCEIFMKDGGFVFAQVHNMLAGMPTKNILAMYDEVNRIRY